jgi:hypothetical protein
VYNKTTAAAASAQAAHLWLLLCCVVRCRNVIGIEIENTVDAVVQHNTASNNTAGIVVQL